MTPPLLLLGCIAFALSCSTDSRKPTKNPPPSPEAAIPAESLSANLGDANLTSYWAQGDAALAAQRYGRRDWKGARSAFAALDLADTSQVARRNLMVALCDAHLGNHREAVKALEATLSLMPHLADFLHHALARSYFFAGSAELAMKHARSVRGSSIHGADAELLVGDLLRGHGDAEATYAHYQHYLDSRPTGIRRAEARFRLALAAESLGKTEEARRHLQTIMAQAPLSKWASRAQRQATQTESLSAAALIERGHVYYRKNRNESSEADFAAALAAGNLDAEAKCDASYHRANSVYKQRDRTRAAPLFLQALKSCDNGLNADLYVKAAYQAGRSFATLGQNDKALAHYSLIESKHPTHTYADDARLLRAETYEKLGDGAKVRELLSSIADTYPDGDMGPEALWRLAWRAYKENDWKQAIGWLQKQIDSKSIDDRFWAEGQAHYWLGRASANRGDTEASIAAYRQVIKDYPLSYYSLLALNRLREKHPTVFSEVREQIRDSSEHSPEEGALRFREREEYESPGFARVVEFLRLGLTGPATSELHRLGFRSPTGRNALTDDDEIDKAWAVSFLHHSIGNWSQALWSTRWHVLDYKRHWPQGGWRQRWEIAYPPGYGDLIEKYAHEHGIPSELVTSFVREESGFDPIQESFANAIGLAQIIIPTAVRFAEGTGIKVSRETLQVPENNIRIATNFMAFLMKKWNGKISLVAPSYNAGETAVARWQKERSDWDRDAFAEEIPYDETRRYSKRVIASYFTYRYLLHDEVPVFAN